MTNKEMLIEKLYKELDIICMSRCAYPFNEKEQVAVRDKLFSLLKEIDDYYLAREG